MTEHDLRVGVLGDHLLVAIDLREATTDRALDLDGTAVEQDGQLARGAGLPTTRCVRR